MPLAILSGCGIGTLTVANNYAGQGAETVPAVRINGKVHGGAYPIQNATVILTETQSNGVWTAANNAYVGTAKPLYVTTSDANGAFSFPDTGWSCDAGQYVYVEVTGGKTAAATNSNVVQVAVVGDCSEDLGNTALIDGINVFLSEPSTVAAAYALRSFTSIHSGNLSGVASDGKATLTTTIPLVDITAPASNNVVSSVAALNPASTATGAVQVSMASAYNARAIYTDGSTFSTTGGFDGDGSAYSSQLIGTNITYAGVPYSFGPTNRMDAVRGSGSSVIALTSGNFNTLNILAAGTNGTQTNQTFTVTYTDGSTTDFSQSLSDWLTSSSQGYAGEATAFTGSYRNLSDGTKDARQFSLYQYSFPLNKAKLVKSLTLPNNANVVVMAVTATSNLPACNGVRAGTALACTAAGLGHGFQNAYNLVDQVTFSASQFPTGVSRTKLPGNNKAFAPREMVNTLGNILQECVDSGGGTASSGYVVGTSRCGDLFFYTAPPSTTTYPTNTLQAAMNMATYPTNNVNQLMALKPRNVFFSPEITQMNSPQPFGFTLSIFYKGTGLGDTFTGPADLALDVQDNVYVAYGSQTTSVLDELTSAGTGVFSTTLTNVAKPKSLALDTNGYAWVTDDTASTGGITGLYTSVNATNSAAQGSAYSSVAVANGSAAGLAFDASNNIFVTRDSGDTNATAFLYTAASAYKTINSYKLNYPIQRAISNSVGDFYAVGSNGSTSEWISYPYAVCGTGTAPLVSTISSSSALSMAVNDNNGNNNPPAYNAFVPSSGQVSTLNSKGTSCAAAVNYTPANNETGLTSTSPAGAAMDGGLNLFWSDSATGYIYSMAGAGSSTDISAAAVTSFAPCFYTGGACASTSSAAYQGMAIDSSGAMWVLSRGGTYGLVQTLGMGAPTWPLLASQNAGVTVQ